MTQHQELAERLRQRLRELTGRAEAIEDDLRHALDADSSERAVDLADDESLIGVDDVIRDEIRQVRAALSRIANGTYGVCVKCGAQLAPERLRALPTARQCVKCS